MMKYAVKDAYGNLLSIFDAADFADAVAAKLMIQHMFNARRSDDVCTMDKAIPKESRDFRPASIIVGPPR
jgi:hypothetical protein